MHSVFSGIREFNSTYGKGQFSTANKIISSVREKIIHILKTTHPAISQMCLNRENIQIVFISIASRDELVKGLGNLLTSELPTDPYYTTYQQSNDDSKEALRDDIAHEYVTSLHLTPQFVKSLQSTDKANEDKDTGTFHIKVTITTVAEKKKDVCVEVALPKEYTNEKILLGKLKKSIDSVKENLSLWKELSQKNSNSGYSGSDKVLYNK